MLSWLSKVPSPVPEKSLLSSDHSACFDTVLPLKGETALQEPRTYVRAESKFWCLLARKHSKFLITVRFCVCVPFCWLTHIHMLPCIHMKQQPKLELPRDSKKESVSLACVCLVTRKQSLFIWMVQKTGHSQGWAGLQSKEEGTGTALSACGRPWW